MKKLTVMILSLIFVLTLAWCVSGCLYGEPWTWAQTLQADDISSAAVWYNVQEQASLSPDETFELVSLLNGLKQSDFTENKNFDGATPSYGISIKTADGTYLINESIAKAGSLQVKYGRKMWWIDNGALSSFIKGKIEE